jgi:diguanylate cyclase (GGDEF)-like protein
LHQDSRVLNRVLDRVRALLAACDAPYGIALFDVDFYCAFRETYGATNATESVARLERSLRAALPADRMMLERVSDDSFLAIFPGASLRESADLADRMRFACASNELRLPGVGTVALSLSAGVAAADGFSSLDELLSAVESSLLVAKRSGRNCVAAGNRVDLVRDARTLQLRHAWHPARGRTTAGREAEMAKLGLLLGSERFITLTGPSGIGKTHLAAATAALHQRRFPDGIFFIDMSETGAINAAQMQIAEALGVRQSDPGSALHAAASLLRAQEALLILDDCSPATHESSAAIASLLEACPSLRVLVTARTPLGAIGERAMPVGPLDDASAVKLYRELMRTTIDDQGVRAICRRLEGNPFALGVVAAAPGEQSLDALASELEGLSKPEFLLEWRFSHLDEDAQDLLPHLSVFRGGWSPADAGAVSGEPAAEVAPALRRLVEARLVVSDSREGAARFRLPRTVREFARRRLLERAELNDVAQRHAEHFAAVLTAALDTWRTTPTRMWVPALERELGNLRAALHWSIEERHAPQTGARIARGSSELWTALGLPHEGVRYVLALLDHPSLDEPMSAALHAAAARLLLDCSRPVEARVHALRAAEYAREANELLLLARATQFAAMADIEAGNDRAGALGGLTHALELYRVVRNRQGEAEALNAIAIFHHSAGEFEPAMERYRDALRIFRSLGNEHGTLIALSNIGALHYMHGDIEDAIGYFHECAIRREQDVAMHRLDLALMNYGEAELACGNLDAASALLGRALNLLAITPNDWVLAMALTNVARIALTRNNPRAAVALAGFCDATFERLTQPRQPTQDRIYRAMMNDAEMLLGGEAYHQAYTAGRSYSSEAALDAAARV